MNDEITAARRKKRIKVQARRFFFFVVALVVLLSAALAVNSVSRTTFLDVGDFFTALLKGGGGYPAKLGDSAPIEARRMSMACAVVTKAELITFSSGGARLMTARHGYLNPCMDAAENRILLYNVGSKDVSIYNRTQNIASFSEEYAIIDAKVADDGTAAVLTRSGRYACQLNIYSNGDYRKLLTWYGASGFPLGAYISDDGTRAAAARTIARNGEIYTVMASIDILREEEEFELEFAGVTMAAYYVGNGMIAVTDRGAYQIDADGKVESAYAFPVTPVLGVAKDQGSNIAVAFGDNNQPDVNRVVILKNGLVERGTIEGCGAVSGMYISGGRLYILGGRTVSEYGIDGGRRARYDAGPNAVAALDLNGLVVVTPDSLIRPSEPIKEEERTNVDTL
jgi:hypothetical protein